MFDYKISKHPHFDEACRAFALRHNMAKLAERAGMNVQTLRNKLNPDQPHQLNAPEIWLLTDLTEDSTLIDGFLAQIHCLPCVPINEVAKEKLPHYVMSATAEIGRVAAGAVSLPRWRTVRRSVSALPPSGLTGCERAHRGFYGGREPNRRLPLPERLPYGSGLPPRGARC